MTRTRKTRRAIDTPPKQFPAIIRPHAYDESGLGTCLECGQRRPYRLHISPHSFEVNLTSRLKKCMCGYSELHFIHRRVN